jgi:hypothetical protein
VSYEPTQSKSSPASSEDLTGVVSMASSPPPPADVDEPCSKRAKFEKCFNVATLTNEEILCMFFITKFNQH